MSVSVYDITSCDYCSFSVKQRSVDVSGSARLSATARFSRTISQPAFSSRSLTRNASNGAQAVTLRYKLTYLGKNVLCWLADYYSLGSYIPLWIWVRGRLWYPPSLLSDKLSLLFPALSWEMFKSITIIM